MHNRFTYLSILFCKQILKDEIEPVLNQAKILSAQQREKYSTKQSNLPFDVEEDILALEAANISISDVFEKNSQELEEAREQREELKKKVVMVKKILEENTEEIIIIDIPAAKHVVEVRIT